MFRAFQKHEKRIQTPFLMQEKGIQKNHDDSDGGLALNSFYKLKHTLRILGREGDGKISL